VGPEQTDCARQAGFLLSAITYDGRNGDGEFAILAGYGADRFAFYGNGRANIISFYP
jgi:hypothetical protein